MKFNSFSFKSILDSIRVVFEHLTETMISYSIFLVLFSTLMSFEVLAQFPQSDPYKWNPLSSETNRKLGSYGGGNGQSGSINIAGRE